MPEYKQPRTCWSVFYEERALALIALRIGVAVEYSGMSDTEICDKAGVSKGTLRRILAASGNVSVRSLAKVAYALGCVVDTKLESTNEDDT